MNDAEIKQAIADLEADHPATMQREHVVEMYRNALAFSGAYRDKMTDWARCWSKRLPMLEEAA